MEILQKENKVLLVEKNIYMTIFDNVDDPIIFINKENNIENFNKKAVELLLDDVFIKIKDRQNFKIDHLPFGLNEEFIKFIEQEKNEICQKITVESKKGCRTFMMKFKKLMDVREGYKGSVIIFNDITEWIKEEQLLKDQLVKLEQFEISDPLTGVLSRRIGLWMLKKELAMIYRKYTPTTICYIEIDNLKKIIETFEQEEGDNLMAFISETIMSSVREIDTVSRMDKNEFFIIFPDCHESDAEKVIKRISEVVSLYGLKYNKPYKPSFTHELIELTSMKDYGNANL